MPADTKANYAFVSTDRAFTDVDVSAVVKSFGINATAAEVSQITPAVKTFYEKKPVAGAGKVKLSKAAASWHEAQIKANMAKTDGIATSLDEYFVRAPANEQVGTVDATVTKRNEMDIFNGSHAKVKVSTATTFQTLYNSKGSFYVDSAKQLNGDTYDVAALKKKLNAVNDASKGAAPGDVLVRMLASLTSTDDRIYGHLCCLRADKNEGAIAYNRIIRDNKATKNLQVDSATYSYKRPELSEYETLSTDRLRNLAFLEIRVNNGRALEILDAVFEGIDDIDTDDSEAEADLLFDIRTSHNVARCRFVYGLLNLHDGIVAAAKPTSHQEPTVDAWDHLHDVVGKAGPISEDGLIQRGHWMRLGPRFRPGVENKHENKKFWLSGVDAPLGTKSAWIPDGKGRVEEIWFSDAADAVEEEARAVRADRVPYAVWSSVDAEDRWVVDEADSKYKTDSEGVVQRRPLTSTIIKMPPLSVIDPKTGKVKPSTEWNGTYYPSLIPAGKKVGKDGKVIEDVNAKLNPTLPKVQVAASASSSSSSSSSSSYAGYSSYGGYGGYSYPYSSYGSYGYGSYGGYGAGYGGYGRGY